jgi:hypothetical protein
MFGQPDIDKNNQDGTKPAHHQVNKKNRVTEDLVIFVENMDNRIINQKKTEDKKDYPPFLFV